MKAVLLASVFLASVTVFAQSNQRAGSKAASAAECKQDLTDAIQRQKEEASDLQSEIANLRALMTMLRSNAGIVRDSSLRNALQVDADMWESLMNHMQKHVTRLQDSMQDKEAKIKIRCGGR